jgi:hypothetical protein
MEDSQPPRRLYLTNPISNAFFGGGETTVSIDNILAELLALKLGRQPDDEDAHQAVRLWLQATLDKSVDPDRIHLSQWLQARIIEEIAFWELREKRDEWLDRKAPGRKSRRRRSRPPECKSKGRRPARERQAIR